MTTSLLRPSLGVSNPSTSSRSSSFFPTSGSNTPLGFSNSIASSSQNLTPSHSQDSQAHHEQHRTKISSKLKHMFDTQKYALFETTVTIHELGNVPQLSGEFDVQWKFRGKRPRSKEILELTKNGHAPLPKPSLPNLKLQSTQAAASTASIGTTSTASSGGYPPTPRSLLNPASTAGPSRPAKSLSLPPPRDSFERPEKKGSEPTPLKQVITPGSDSPGYEVPGPTESPQQLTDEPSVFEDDDEDDASRSRSTSGSSHQSSLSKPGIPPLISIHRPSMTASSRPSRSSSGVSTPTDRLAVPFPKSVPVPVRGGTTPSYSTLIDPMKDMEGSSRRGMDRTISMATTATSSSTSASTTTTNIPSRPSFLRARSASGPGWQKAHNHQNTEDHSDWLSEMRKGTTPSKSLRSHSVKWDYELHHIIRVPLGKPIQLPSTPTTANGNGTNPYRQKSTGPPLPCLGDGPLSDSGLKLIIEQLPITSHKPGHSHLAPDDHDSSNTSHGKNHDGAKEAMVNGVRKEMKEKSIFGIVNIDLAAFAGKGKMTRRFLLKGSRTNATIKLSVDMRWIGGEEKWAAPPMQEGHHVAGVHDFMPDTQETLRSDLGLVKTPSNSSSGSSIGLELQRTRTAYSTVSSNYPTRNASMTELGRSITHHSYQSYENHLAPSVSRKSQISDSPQKDPRPLSSHSNVASGRQSPINKTPQQQQPLLNLTETSRGPIPRLGPSPVILNISKAHNHHKHHTHHLRRHHGGGHHHHSTTHGISDLPPEVIIEAIFNPHPASVNGPFTYVPQDQIYNDTLENEKQVLDRVIQQGSSSSSDGTNSNGSRSKNGTGPGTGTGGNTPENVIDLNDDDLQHENTLDKDKNGNGHGGNKHKIPWRKGMRARAKAEREQKERQKAGIKA